MNLKEYIQQVSRQWQTGDATEHSYRGMLAALVQDIVGSGFVVVNEPSRIQCGAPDYVVLRAADHQPVFYIEAKDIGDADLDGRNPKGHREQFDRYKGALGHIVFTDYLDFHFYEHGQWTHNVRLGEIRGNKIVAVKDSWQPFTEQISRWSQARVQPVTTASRLADIMAQKARLLRHVTLRTMSLMADAPTDYQDSQLLQLFNAFRGLLVSDLTVEGFADMYAQTIVYGLFAARLHDTTPQDFSREEAARLIPRTNPFLRRIFNNIAGIDLDDRVAWIVDDLVETFAATDVAKVMEDYGRNDHRNDPMVHFYEDFLTRYDARLRRSMGVWYTPKPVVGFIVSSVHELLKSLFHMPLGLADTSKVQKAQSHRLQILDPATGTATFLAEIIMLVYDVVGKRNRGLWTDYVERELKPRLNGFEIMMAPYTIAHLKLDMLLQELGGQPQGPRPAANGGRRLNIFLTNSLEPPSAEPRSLFNAISMEAEEADRVKRDKPVMVIVGNPPYNVSSANKGKWILNLIQDYKQGLNERKINLDDDYIKFIRLGEYYIGKNGQGILGYITNNSYLDGVTHREMRRHLMQTFSRIYIVNLHGSAKRRETAPDGGKDENVFNIQQGVAIAIFVKTQGKHDAMAKVGYADLYGTREAKFNALGGSNVLKMDFQELSPQPPYYFFVPKDLSAEADYHQFFAISDLMPHYVSGIETKRDKLVVQPTREACEKMVGDLRHLDAADIADKYQLQDDGTDWKTEWAKKDAMGDVRVVPYLYRPFDVRYVPFTGKSKGIMGRPRTEIMKYLLDGDNLSLITTRLISTGDFRHVFVTDNISDRCSISSQTKETGLVFPLYIYQDNMGVEERVANFRAETYNRIAGGLGFRPKPEDLLAYVYAVLHSPQYRERYKELLKIDFPRVPYPKDAARFNALAALGRRLMDLHLMRGADQWELTVGFPESGSNIVECHEYNNGKVWINATQHFSDVSPVAWDAWVGGYQPARKWLKDRRGHRLSYDDIIHYERVIYALDTTFVIMQQIERLLK